MRLAVILVSLIIPALATCPPGTTHSPYRNKCLNAIPVPLDYRSAALSCGIFDSRLAKIESAEEHNVLIEHLGSRSISGSLWLGGTNVNTTWSWHDGKNFTFTNWKVQEPSNPDRENCLQVHGSSGLWVSGACGKKAAYVCEMEPLVSDSGCEVTTCPPCPACPTSTAEPCPEITECPICPTDTAETTTNEPVTTEDPTTTISTTTTTTDAPTTTDEPTTTTKAPTTTTTTREAPTTTFTTTLAPTTTKLPPSCPFKSSLSPSPSSKRPFWIWNGLYRYAYITEQKSFAEAEATCAYYGAHLASIHSWAEGVFVADLIPIADRQRRNMWVGGISTGNGHFCWSDHSKWDYVRVDDSYSDKNGHCVSIYYPNPRWHLKFKWTLQDCEAPAGFVCKKWIF